MAATSSQGRWVKRQPTVRDGFNSSLHVQYVVYLSTPVYRDSKSSQHECMIHAQANQTVRSKYIDFFFVSFVYILSDILIQIVPKMR